MRKVTLKNGLTVIYEPRKSNVVAIEVLIKVGSSNEKENERGISHFIEHMLFEGTKKRPTNKDIANEIEKIGGDLNAYTSNERTCFYIKVLKKHFDIALDVLADILQNPLFNEKEIEKEKNVVCKEIDLVNDEPRYYQWILFQKNLFEKHPTKYPTYGKKKIVKGLTLEKIKSYYEQNYIPNNMVISIVGDIKDWKHKIEGAFSFKEKRKVKGLKFVEPPAKRNKTVKEKRNIANTYLILGYKTVPAKHKDSAILEVIDGVLGRGQSGKMFNEIRGKRGLAYDVGTQHVSEIDYGYFSVYCSIDKENINLVKKLMLEQLKEVKNITEEELKEAKTYIEGTYFLELEDSQKLADNLALWEQVKDVSEMKNFIERVKRVNLKDVKMAVEKYFKNYTLAIVEGK
jgi:predicted Zn-dependent peptidase